MSGNKQPKSESGIIYGLVDPESGYIRYIGRTIRSLESRLKEHRQGSRRYRTHCVNWIASLSRKGLAFETVVLETVAVEDINSAEQWWVAFARSTGWPLTNLTGGGDGHLGHSPSLDIRTRISQTLTGHLVSKATRQRQRAAKMRPEEQARLLGDRNPAKSPEVRAKISASKNTPEMKARTSAWVKASWARRKGEVA